MKYLVRSPRIFQRLYPRRVWEMGTYEKKIYLSFDDGPHPVHTVFVLDELRKYRAKATFFCIGSNVQKYPDVYRRILDEGHSVGNHTYRHLNGMKSTDADYVADVTEAEKLIDSRLFRPPYGRLRAFSAKLLTRMKHPFKIIMWTVLSGDFDPGISAKRCLENVVINSGNGSIIVFHDSEKASVKLREVLPAALKNLAGRGYSFERISFRDPI